MLQKEQHINLQEVLLQRVAVLRVEAVQLLRVQNSPVRVVHPVQKVQQEEVLLAEAEHIQAVVKVAMVQVEIRAPEIPMVNPELML